MLMLVLRIIAPCGLADKYRRFRLTYTASILSPEDGGNIFLRNDGIYPRFQTALQLRSPTSTKSYLLTLIFATLRNMKITLKESYFGSLNA
jgi:hypothetical protein